MPFSVGTAVAVAGLHTHGRVLEVLPGGRYRIAVGGLTMICAEGQLETVTHSKKQQRRAREAPSPPAQVPEPVSVAPDSSRFQSIDLHGMTVPEALAALPPFIDRAIRAGLTHVRIIHGISGGRLRMAVRECLSGVPSVVCAVPEDGNPGVTVAHF